MSKKILALVLSFMLAFNVVQFVYGQTQVVTLQAEESITSSRVTTTQGSSITYASVDETGYVTFEINVQERGVYSFNLRASGAYEASVNLSLDSVPLLQMNLRKTNGENYFDDNIAFAELPEGSHTLKISATSEVLNLDYITVTHLSGVSKSIYKNFLDEINASKTYDKYAETIEKYAESFNIDIASLTKRVFYKLPIYEELAGRTYDDLNDAIKDFYDVVKKYQNTNSQPVLAYNGRVPLTELQSGDLSFYVKTSRLTKPVTIICAIYKNSALYKMNMGSYTNQTQVIITIDGVEITEEDNYSFKTFYIDDLTSIKSYDAYSEIYKEIFVSPKGDDNNDGTKESPVKTISAAKAIVSANNSSMTGDIVVNIVPGEYYLKETEKLLSEHSGKNGYNVIFKGTDIENPPVIHGGIKVTDWQEHKDGIYKAPLKGFHSVRNLYVDGYNAVRARSKNTFQMVEYYDDAETQESKDGYKVLSKRMPYTFSRPQDLETVWELGWCCQRVPVAKVFADGEYTVFKAASLSAVNKIIGTETININQYKYFYLENAMELLDEPGEFYYNSDEEMIYYYPSDGENLDNVYVPSTERLFEVGSKEETSKTENIIFDNLDIRYGAWDDADMQGLLGIQADQLIDLENPDGKTIMMHSQFAINNASGVEIVNCSFSCLGSNAISLEDCVADSKIEGNVIRDISGTAISIGTWEHTVGAEGVTMCRNIDVKNNVIRRAAQEYRGCTAIAVYYENSINICHNDISDLPYTGITAGWGWGANIYTAGNFSICHNKVSDVMNCLYDGSNIYTLGPLKDSAIYENYLTDSKYVISGIYTDSGSRYLKIFGNVILEEDLDSYWWYQGHNNTADLHAYSNYTTTGKVRIATESNNIEENTVLITEGVLPQEAQTIKDNAGLENEYLHLLEEATLPEGKVNIAKTTPKEPHASGAFRYASDYDRSYDPQDGNIPITSREYLSFNKDEWVEFDIEIEKAGTYSLYISAANGWADKVTSTVSVYLDGVLQFDGSVAPTDGWSPFVEFEIGELNLKAGKNVLRIKNSNTHGYGFHLSTLILEK